MRRRLEGTLGDTGHKTRDLVYSSEFPAKRLNPEPVAVNCGCQISRLDSLGSRGLQKPFIFNAGGGTRTRTELSLQRILSPLRMPFRHPGRSSEHDR
jgi:hypothetical protein